MLREAQERRYEVKQSPTSTAVDRAAVRGYHQGTESCIAAAEFMEKEILNTGIEPDGDDDPLDRIPETLARFCTNAIIPWAAGPYDRMAPPPRYWDFARIPVQQVNETNQEAQQRIQKATAEMRETSLFDGPGYLADIVAYTLAGAKAFCNRARAYGEKGEWDKAIADCTEAIRLDPKFAEAYTGRGWNYYHKGEDDSAIVDFTEGIRWTPKNALAYYGRSLAYDNRGEKHKAEADLAKWQRLGRGQETPAQET